MYYEPNWKKSECGSGRLKSIDFNMESKLLKIIEYQENGRECLKQVSIDKIEEIKLIVHYSTGKGPSVVYLDFLYHKNIKNGRIIVYLPWRYDEEMIEKLHEIAGIYNIPFRFETNKKAFLGLLFIIFIVTLICLLFNYNL
jgi:hypothetical protein